MYRIFTTLLLAGSCAGAASAETLHIGNLQTFIEEVRPDSNIGWTFSVNASPVHRVEWTTDVPPYTGLTHTWTEADGGWDQLMSVMQNDQRNGVHFDFWFQNRGPELPVRASLFPESQWLIPPYTPRGGGDLVGWDLAAITVTVDEFYPEFWDMDVSWDLYAWSVGVPEPSALRLLLLLGGLLNYRGGAR